MNPEPIQLSLGVTLNDDCTFNNFYAAEDANIQAVSVLQKLVRNEGEKNVLIWGARGCGLSHLLQSVCHEAWSSDQSVQYLPLSEVIGFSAQDVCEGMEETKIICLDGIDHICGIKEWENALFHLYNNVKDAGCTLLIASHTSPPSLPIILADLRSRVLGCVRYHIESLSDAHKQAAMTMRAASRGLDLPGDVARYILSRASRDTHVLFNLLDKLDEASLQKQRKLTIPFIKEVLHF